MKKIIFILLFVLMFLVLGCSSYWDVEEKNKQDVFEKKVLDFIERDECPDCLCSTVCSECPDCICECANVSVSDEYIRGLRLEAKKCEKSQYYYDMDECHSELNWTRDELDRVVDDCEEDLQDSRDDYNECRNETDGIDEELRDCKKNWCNYNGSFC